MHEKLIIPSISRLAGVSHTALSALLNCDSSIDSTLRKRVTCTGWEHDLVCNVTTTRATRCISPDQMVPPSLSQKDLRDILRSFSSKIEGDFQVHG